jgi:hypothetical protein
MAYLRCEVRSCHPPTIDCGVGLAAMPVMEANQYFSRYFHQAILLFANGG